MRAQRPRFSFDSRPPVYALTSAESLIRHVRKEIFSCQIGQEMQNDLLAGTTDN